LCAGGNFGQLGGVESRDGVGTALNLLMEVHGEARGGFVVDGPQARRDGWNSGGEKCVSEAQRAFAG
jgi:hypothetical protein